MTLLLAGDALLTRPWSHVRDADFLGLIGEIRGADVAIANLETVIHEFKGHAQADAGGVHMASPPSIAAELKWAGFDMLAHANNHAFDYGASGVLETIEHAERAGLVIAGSGPDLQRARAPRYFQCDGARVALVAMAADYIAYGKASPARPDLHGRPGVNPLTVVSARSMTLRPLRPLEIAVSWGRKIDAADRDANLESVTAAVANADIVVVSIHAHRRGDWLVQFAHHAIERGASAIVVTGPHQVRGVELYRGRPIFYSLGDLAFETEYIARFPPEVYERVGLAPDAPIEELRARSVASAPLSADRQTFEGLVAQLSMAGGQLKRIQLLPIDLQFDGHGERRGRPKLASAELAERIVAMVAAKSKKFGTQVRYDRDSNRGEVVLGGASIARAARSAL